MRWSIPLTAIAVGALLYWRRERLREDAQRARTAGTRAVSTTNARIRNELANRRTKREQAAARLSADAEAVSTTPAEDGQAPATESVAL